MTVTATPIYPQTINSSVVTILPADTTTLKTLYTGGTNGSKVENIVVTNTDSTAAYVVQIYITISSTNYLIGTINVPLSSGNTTSAPGINVISNSNVGTFARDPNGNAYIYVANGAVLKVASTTTVTTAKALTFYAQGGDY
jgi:hypothetical protein